MKYFSKIFSALFLVPFIMHKNLRLMLLWAANAALYFAGICSTTVLAQLYFFNKIAPNITLKPSAP